MNAASVLSPPPHTVKTPRPRRPSGSPARGVTQMWLLPTVAGGVDEDGGVDARLAREEDARAAYGPSIGQSRGHVTGQSTEPSSRSGPAGDDQRDGHRSLDIYAWARALPLPTAAEERAWCARMRGGDKRARERLFEGVARWALSIAQWYTTERAPLDDLAQVAWLTLWRVIPDFEPQRGRLTTFVSEPIHRDVRRAVDEMSSLIRRPVGVVEAERREWRFYERYAAEHGCEPSLELVAAALDTPPSQARLTQRREERRPIVVSLDAPHASIGGGAAHGGSGGGAGMAATWTLADTLAAPAGGAHDPVARGERADRSARITQFVAGARLSQRQRQVLALMYSDDPRVCGNLAAIGRVLGMTRERVRQVHDAALAQLRKANSRSGGELSAIAAEADD